MVCSLSYSQPCSVDGAQSQPATGDLQITQTPTSPDILVVPDSQPSQITAENQTADVCEQPESASSLTSPKSSQLQGSLEHSELNVQNKKLRARLIKLEAKNEVIEAKYHTEIIAKNAKITDLMTRLATCQKQCHDDMKIVTDTHQIRVNELENEIQSSKDKLSVLTKELDGAKVDNETLYRKVQLLTTQLKSMPSKSEDEVISCSQPQSISRNTSSPDSNSAEKGKSKTKHVELEKKSTSKPKPVVNDSKFSGHQRDTTPTVHLMYSSNGKKMAGTMRAFSNNKVKVTASVYSGGNIQMATNVIRQGDIAKSTDYKIIGFGTNNIKSDNPTDIVYELKNLVQTARSHHPSSKLILCGIHHRCDSDDNSHIYMMNNDIDYINAQMAEFCRNQKVDFIDINSINRSTARNPNFSVLYNDGLHFNTRGRNILAIAMLEIIKQNSGKTYANIIASRRAATHNTRDPPMPRSKSYL
ncbi:unnamed protein product [Owenia fusiformis]|uniref:SGNH hydrolase-type esterase domain-containing protein n=1 Tax=Owenia fusiformis TaxID=6347 RepID=A0A8J1T6Z0_OWEFU|nr:unnamed protein product [Owenia fusiformis]